MVAYGRDRQEDGIDTRHYDTLKAYERVMLSEGGHIEYVYLYIADERKWVWAPAHFGSGMDELRDLTEQNVAA